MSSRRAVFPAKEDDLQVQLVPGLSGKDSLEILLGLNHILSTGQLPAPGQPVDMGIDRKGGHPKCLAHDHGSRLVPYSRKAFQCLHVLRHFPIITITQDHRQFMDRL